MSSGIGKKQEISKLEARIYSILSSIGTIAAIVIKYSPLLRRDSIRSLFPYRPNPCPCCFRGEMSSVLPKQAQARLWHISYRPSSISRTKDGLNRDKALSVS
jgi:hypothetical protein